jgi:hypothetical protein
MMGRKYAKVKGVGVSLQTYRLRSGAHKEEYSIEDRR